MKTMLLWKRARARTWKMQGTATAVCSAATISQFCSMAEDKKGHFAIVHAENAEEARIILRAWKDAPERFKSGMVTSRADGRILAFGPEGAHALAGTAHAIANWDHRIQTQGRVSANQSRAIRPDVAPEQFLTPDALLSGKAPVCPAVPAARYSEDVILDNIEVSFESKPERALLDALKGHGFRWSSRGKCWRAKRTDERKRLALAIVAAGGVQ
jgi:hypothetical protein